MMPTLCSTWGLIIVHMFYVWLDIIIIMSALLSFHAIMSIHYIIQRCLVLRSWDKALSESL